MIPCRREPGRTSRSRRPPCSPSSDSRRRTLWSARSDRSRGSRNNQYSSGRWPRASVAQWSSCSEPRRDGEEELTGRRIRGEIDASERRLAEVADLRIVTVVLRDQDQIASRRAQLHAVRAKEVAAVLK